MHQGLDEILEVSEHTLGDEKPDTKEYYELLSVVNSIKEHLQRAKSSKLTSELATKDDNYNNTDTGFTSHKEEISTVGSSFAVSTEDEDSRDYRMKRVLEDGVPPLDPRLQYLSNEEALNKLSFVCGILLTRDTEHNVSNMPKHTTRTLVNALELAAVVLNSGVIPCDLECITPPPSISCKTYGTVSKQSFSSNINQEDTVSAEVPTPQSPLPQKTNIRISLVDAVLASGDMVHPKESNEKLCFIFIASLVAAAVPRMCRDSSQLLSTVDIRYHTLVLYGPRLMKVIQLLFSIFSFSNISSLLFEEVKKALNQLLKAIFKHAELKVRLAEEGGRSHFLHTGQNRVDIKNNSNSGDVVPGENLIEVLKFCSRIAQVAPLTSDDTDTARAVVHDTISSPDGGTLAVLCEKKIFDNDSSNKVLTSYCVSTALNFILHIIVRGGSVFHNTEPVICCVRQNVIPAVVRTSLSTDIDIFRLSLKILLHCCMTYGPQLVNENSTIFRHVYFRVLESKFTSLMHKSMVIEVFQCYIEEPQNLLNLFLNYDCNTCSYSIYEEMIGYLDALSRPLRKHFLIDNNDKDNYFESLEAFIKVKLPYEVPESLRRKALATLLLVSGSNVQWIDRFKTNKQGKSDCKCEEDETNSPQQMSKSMTLETFAPLGVENDENIISGKLTSDLMVTNENDITEQKVRRKAEGSYEEEAENTESLQKFGTTPESTSSRQSEDFLKAKHYKDTIKAFFILFNEVANPEVAIDYLYSSILLPNVNRGNEGFDSKNALAAAIARITKTTNPPKNYTPNMTLEDKDAVVLSSTQFFFPMSLTMRGLLHRKKQFTR
ncbi:unnamed protein product [Phytomonas sp. Hart1]|nr:unnamed protein product [Phytomonas sp. Hart1]|eukprot:CCW66529.1 unnamed protein product [Phytomonas sp. isolate Hart1]